MFRILRFLFTGRWNYDPSPPKHEHKWKLLSTDSVVQTRYGKELGVIATIYTSRCDCGEIMSKRVGIGRD